MDYALITALAFAGLVVVASAWLGWQLLRQNGRFLLRLEALEERLNELEFGEAKSPEGLPIGSQAPNFELADLAGGSRSLADFSGRPLLLVFFNPACGFCRELAPKLAALLGVRREAQHEAALPAMTSSGSPSESAVVAGALESGGKQPPQVLVVTTGEAEANRSLFAEHGLRCPVLLQEQSEVASAYHANGTPSGYLINAQGKIASGLVMGSEAILKLFDEKVERSKPEWREKQKAEADQAHGGLGDGNGEDRAERFSQRSLARSKVKRDGLKAGTSAPDFRLPRLDGRGDLSLSELRGKRVLLVFSSPGCGPCNTLAPHLEKYHCAHPELEVVMISKGDPKDNRTKVREFGLTFPIVLQRQWEISRRYAMFATPIAYLIDEHGVIAQEVAVGSDAIVALLTNSGVPQRSVRTASNGSAVAALAPTRF